MTFGPHLTLDMAGCDKEAIHDLNVVAEFLTRLPEILGMTIIDPPKVIKYSGLVPEDYGVTGWVTIAESHCAFHSFTGKGYAFIDVFSCKPFDLDLAVKCVKSYFSPKTTTLKIVERGLDFPR